MRRWVWAASCACFVAACAEPEETGYVFEPGPPCPAGQLADGGACVPEACGTGTWGDLPLDEGAVYVDGYAPEGGDGSAEAPFQTLQEGADAAGEGGGGLVAIAAGTYLETPVLDDRHDGVHLAGRCREMVTVDGYEGDWEAPAVLVRPESSEPRLALSDLTITRGYDLGLSVYGGEVTLQRLDLTENLSGGLLVKGESARAEIADSLVRHSMRGQHMGWGINVNSGATLRAERCIIADNSTAGVYLAWEGTHATFVDTVIRDTRHRGESWGAAVAELGAELVLEGCTIAGNDYAGVRAEDEGTRVSAVDSAVLDTRPAEGGAGVYVKRRAHVALEGSRLEDNSRFGVFAHGADTEVSLVDSEVRRTHADEDGSWGRGLEVEDGAVVTAVGSTIEQNTGYGVFSTGDGSRIELVRSAVRDTRSNVMGTKGRGIQAQRGGTVIAEASLIDGNHEFGILATGEGSRITLRDGTVVRGTQTLEDGERGHGAWVQSDATFDVDEAVFETNSEVGIYAGSNSVVSLEDTLVRGTRRQTDLTTARGLSVKSGVDFEATRLVSADNEGVGLEVYGAERALCTDCALEDNAFAGAIVLDGGSLELEGAWVRRNEPDDQEGGGVGVYVSDSYGSGNGLHLSNATITDHPLAAVWLDGNGDYEILGSTLEGGEGVTSGTPESSRQLHGDAVFAMEGVTSRGEEEGLYVADSTLRGATTGLFLHGASATLDGENAFDCNDLDVVRQACWAFDEPVVGLPVDAECVECPDSDRAVWDDLDFDRYLQDVEVAE